MRRTLAATAVALSLALTATPTLVSAADDGARSRPSAAQAANQGGRVDGPGSTRSERATAALERVKALLSHNRASRAQGSGTPEAPGDATLAMRDLFSVLDDLAPAQRREAKAILARPTDGPKFDQDGYTVKSVKKCSRHICLHWVKRSKDAPPNRAWAVKMLRLMNKVWKKEVGKYGYRRPVSDQGKGGNNKFDVYLAQLGNRSLYGYCSPQRIRGGIRYVAAGYCVLDNDYSVDEYHTSPMAAAKATAAHEFFHAIQFGYDYLEDVWMMESTATWMEERVFDDINDNRQYLPAGQLQRTLFPLDYYDVSSGSVYGNWVFFEFLSKAFGNGVVRRIWNKAGAFAGAPDMYSTQAISRVLKGRGGFTKAYSRFVGANLLPSKFYPEGSVWPSAELATATPLTLTSDSRTTGVQGYKLLHMSSLSWKVDSSATLTGPQFKLQVDIDGPKSFRMPAAYVQVLGHDGSVQRHYLKLNKSGAGSVTVPFDYTSVASVYVSLVNASTRFKCGKSYVYSCNGLPIDDGRSFAGQAYRFTASVIES